MHRERLRQLVRARGLVRPVRRLLLTEAGHLQPFQRRGVVAGADVVDADNGDALRDGALAPSVEVVFEAAVDRAAGRCAAGVADAVVGIGVVDAADVPVLHVAFVQTRVAGRQLCWRVDAVVGHYGVRDVDAARALAASEARTLVSQVQDVAQLMRRGALPLVGGAELAGVPPVIQEDPGVVGNAAGVGAVVVIGVVGSLHAKAVAIVARRLQRVVRVAEVVQDLDVDVIEGALVALQVEEGGRILEVPVNNAAGHRRVPPGAAGSGTSTAIIAECARGELDVRRSIRCVVPALREEALRWLLRRVVVCQG